MLSLQKFFLPIGLFLIILLTYWDLPKTFFQQDEWESLAVSIYYQSKGWLGIVQSIFPPDAISHFNPLARVYAWFTFWLFNTNFTPYAWLSIGMHTLNALLLYYFVNIRLNNRKIALISALFFGVNSIPSQAVTWVAAINSYEIPMALILLSLIFFHKLITQKNNRRRNLIASLIMLFLSLMFHENGMFLFFFYPATFFFIAKSEWKKLMQTFLPGIIICLLAFAFIRIPFFFGLTTPLSNMTYISHPPITVYPYRLISMGMKSFAASLVPEKTLIDISDKMVHLAYPQFLTLDKIPNPFITQSIVLDLVSYLLTFLIVCLFILFIKVIREKKVSEAFVWALLFIPASLSPYVLVLGNAGYASIIESKFFYIGSIGVSILIGIIVYSILLKFEGRKVLQITVYLLFGLYLFSHVHAIKMNLNNLEEVSSIRKMLLMQVQSSYPDLPDKVVFFTKSDTAYYGMPSEEKILPLQIGFGRMLMVWYQRNERFPGCLYKGQFLLSPLAQEYRFCNGRGFGNFRNYDKLIASIQEFGIKPEEVIAYSWEGQKEKFIDITKEIRGKIKQDVER